MDSTKIFQKLDDIRTFSKVVYAVSQNNNALFDHLDALNVATKQILFEKYQNESGVVLSLRKKVSEQFLNGKINREEIETLFQNGKRDNPTRFTVYKNLFSILYPFVVNASNEMVYDTLDELAQSLREDLGLKDSTEIKLNGFDGSRNTGDTHAWFAIYNNSHPNQKTAIQLFFSIENGKVFGALYDRKKDHFLDKQEFELAESSYPSILEFCKKHIALISKDNYRAGMLSKYDIPSLVQQLSNGQVKGWLIKPGQKGALWKDALNRGTIFIGWGQVIKDAIEANTFSNEFLINKLNEHYPKEKTDNQINNRISIHSFVKEVHNGDLVFAISGRSDVIGCGIITSETLNNEDEEEYSAYHTVDWLLDISKKPFKPSYTLPIKTVTQLDVESSKELLNDLFNLSPTPATSRESGPLNIILYGPPGTGKTYRSIDKAVSLAAPTKYKEDHAANKVTFDQLRKDGQIEFVTFHQNYTYEDFMVGLKPDVDATPLNFIIHKGIFYQMCKKARDNYEASKLSESLQSFEQLLDDWVLSKISPEQPLEMKTVRGKPFWLTDFSEKTIYLKKSTGSEIHTLSISTLIDVAEGRREMVSGLAVYYNPIIELLKKNRKTVGSRDELKKYVLVIDEINRGNISKVFGELITLLEPDKRIDGENELRITLPNGEKDFAIPPNLYIVGTMNTADKSIALVDIALRRRFEFEGMYPNYSAISDSDERDLLRQLNKAVYEAKKSADYLIGQAYFINHISTENTIKNKVIPLLMEYFMGKTEFVEKLFDGTQWSVKHNKEDYLWTISKNG